MALQSFGSVHTEIKLDKIAAYLDKYTTALKNQLFETIFIDAFAGTGSIVTPGLGEGLFESETAVQAMQGSARRALQIKHPFDKYIFIEKQKLKAEELKKLQLEYPALAERQQVINEDANTALLRICAEFNPQLQRAVVFLDPFGNQVEWKTLTALANTKAVDLWYLFPAGLGVARQISNAGKVHYTHAESLNRLLGTTKWEDTFISQTEEQDLFGSNLIDRKEASPESITRFMIERMKEEFSGGVLDLWLPLGSRRIHMYSLVFAWANPSPKAKLAGKLAEAVLRSDKVGRRK
jgi:three-Cys-motif partner protein